MADLEVRVTPAGSDVSAELVTKLKGHLHAGFVRAAEILRAEVERRAPIDPASRHARGETVFPAVHDKASYIVRMHKKREGEIVARPYVASTSNRGGWINKGTKATTRQRVIRKGRARGHGVGGSRHVEKAIAAKAGEMLKALVIG